MALISTPGDERHPDRDGIRSDDLAVARERVVVGQGEQPDADVERGRTSADGRKDAIRPGRMGVEVDRRGARRLDPAGTGRGQRVVATTARPGRHVTPR